MLDCPPNVGAAVVVVVWPKAGAAVVLAACPNGLGVEGGCPKVGAGALAPP